MEGDYAMITEGMGGVGIHVSSPEEMGGAILKARQLNDEGRTVLIDVKSNFESRKSYHRR
jgi:thiamine pyrophosphate-dependent acetolactate synthase large subunit-like protein